MRIKTHLALASLLIGLSCVPLAQAQSGRQATAIWIRDSAKISLLSWDPYGDHASSARQNIVDTAKCGRARTSARSDVGVTYVWLHTGMLSTMKALTQTYGYSYYAGFIAGGDHSSGSYHYRGTAKDVSTINGRGVSSSNPYWRSYNQRCRDRGAVESLGPGYVGHSTHVHNAWPSGTSASAAGGCITEVSAPSSLNATTVDHNSIKLTWRDNSSIESHFTVQRSGTSSTGPWSTIATLGANVQSYTANSLSSGKKYWFRVRAYNSNDTSPWSNVDNATTKDTKAAAPSGLTATAVSNDQINLAWTDNSNNEDGFKIYRSSNGTNYSHIKTVGINVKTYSNTGLTGNRKYWYRVYAYNTAGNSAASNTASDTTAPPAPTALTATAGSGDLWNTINLKWTDNAGSEVGFKIERATASAGPFTQIATNAASDTTYTATGLAANTTYYFRVRAYNANGNSDYSNTANSATGNAPPVLSAIGNKTVAGGANLTFTATATDPNQSVVTTTWQTFQSYSGTLSKNETIMFNKPANSATTSAFQDTSTNYTLIRTNGPTGNGSTHTLKAGWGFKTGMANYWVRLNTFNVATNPNPTIALDQTLRFKVHSSKAAKIGLGIRETGTTAAYGANGGTTGAIEWVGVTNVVSGNPIPNRLLAANTWTTLSYNIPFEPTMAFTGDGVVPQTGKGVLEHIVIRGEGGTGAYAVYFDDFAVVAQNTLAYTLDAGAPAGASIGRRTGKFTWTPTTAQAGTHTITVRVTDQGGAQDFETIKITVTGTGNNPPVLAFIGNKTVKEATALTFTATATDPDAGQALTFSLLAGAPAGASISTAGAFSWTPTEAQGPGSYPITVRVADNGSPSSNDTETITVTVTEVNTAPVMAAIPTQYVDEMTTFNYTPSATDADLPAQTLTYSLVSGPEGMTINPSSGAISWPTTESMGDETNEVVVRVADNGSPALFAERTFDLVVNEVNRAPTITIGNAATAGIKVADYETFPTDTFNGVAMFRQPNFSPSTGSFLDASPNISTITDEFPEGVAGSRVVKASFSFKTGTTNPWLRFTTFNTTAGNLVPNPTISFTNTVRFSIYSDRAIKVAIGVRETSTTAAIGFDGGYTGTLEWIGATASGTSPVPSRTVDATNWTTLEFALPNETITAFPGSGNGTLTSTTGKGVLEHLAIVPNDGTGAYTIYVDNFEVLAPTTNFVVDTAKTIQLYASATDPDAPAQALTFSLDEGSPTNAVIDSKSGVIEWTPTAEQSPSTNIFYVRVTDDGVPAPLSDMKTVTVRVNKVNTAPRIVYFQKEFFIVPGEPFEYFASAVDDDVPADTLTYSLVGTPPSGMTLDSGTGALAWTPSTVSGTNYATIRVTDNGTPAMFDELTLIIVVSATNQAPALSLSTARATEKVFSFETFTNGTPNEQVLFKKPANSTTTSAYIDTAATNFTTITTSFPAGNANAGAKVLKAQWNFKTGVVDYWVRLTTFNTTFLPNPAFDTTKRLKFDIYTTKALKVGLGIRESNSSAENGANGGTTGAIEYVGVSSKIGTTPVPTRSVAANTWTTLEFDLPTEPCQTLTGDSILAAGQQALEHLILKGEGGSGTYTVYVDNFEVVTTAALPGTISMKSGSTLTFTASGSDPDGHPISYGLIEGPAVTATINASTGAFSWTPDATYNGTTNDVEVFVEDAPPGGTQTKRDYGVVTVIVSSDTLATQAADIGAGETVALEWNAAVGVAYQVQSKDGAGDWTNVGEPIVAASSVESVVVENGDSSRLYRVVEASGANE